MSETRRMTTVLLSPAVVERLDRIIAEVQETGEAGQPWSLDSYGRIVQWASDLACNHGTAEQWTHASREAVHDVANLGTLMLVEIDDTAMRHIEGTLAGAQGVVTYTPTPSTAIWWLLDVARAAGFEAPGEDLG
jgi:hypothetical protein